MKSIIQFLNMQERKIRRIVTNLMEEEEELKMNEEKDSLDPR